MRKFQDFMNVFLLILLKQIRFSDRPFVSLKLKIKYIFIIQVFS